MLKPSIPDIVFRKTIPHPKQNDPTSFYAHVQRHLVPEVRLEVQIFYGSLDCIEAQYPGLDYTFAPHRRRLGRYPWHRRLFRAFDELRLTETEILSLCQWEGTRSAKERYESETKRTIRDTTADEVVAAPQGHGPRARIYWSEDTEPPHVANKAVHVGLLNTNEDLNGTDIEPSMFSGMVGAGQGTEDEETHLPAHGHFADSQREMEAQWEQWMKEAMERNELDRDSLLAAIREGHTFTPVSPASAIYPQSTTPESEPLTGTNHALVLTQPQITQRYNDLRTMLQDLQSANNQLSAENAALAMFLSRSQPETAR